MYKEHLEKAVEFIEKNLKAEISIEDCAKAAGYSKYHFLRIFKEVTGLTPGDYIRKRRITEVVKKIGGNVSFSDIIFDYGFNSKENFTRAFLAEHHILPTEYKGSLNSLKLYEKFRFASLLFTVIPEILELEPFIVVAYKSDEEYTPNFWNKYNSRKWSQKLSGGKVCADYGIVLWDGISKNDYYIGIHKNNAKGDLTETCEISMSGGLYAVFNTPATTHYEFINNVHRTWEYIYSVWLPQSGYTAGGPTFETYVEDSRTYSEKIYIPVKKE